ncbi:hypothetical protein FGB62_12g115 [Gracilaria domingensis]|nr:hypothetical protein FGB62_12g115 [Gracilaria domingensis]
MLSGLLKKSEEERMNLQDLKEALFFEDVDWDKVLEDGYQSAAALQRRATEQTYDLDNFDSERLQSHGIRLEDEELHERREKKGGGDGVFGTGFGARKSSRLAMRIRQRSDMHKVQNGTAIVGFGYSYASASDLSTIRSDTSGSRSSGSRSDTRVERTHAP